MQMDMSGLSDERLQMEREHMSSILDGFPTTMSMDEEVLASMPVSTGTLPDASDCLTLLLIGHGCWTPYVHMRMACASIGATG
jgi:hypothetical protein